MKRHARLKSTGDIIEVRISMDYRGHATWVEDATKTEYYPEELEFLDNNQTLNFDAQVKDLIAFDPMQMEFNPVTMTSRFFQECHLRITQEVIQAALQCASDKQLQEEVKRRADERKALKGGILRCRDCKYCGEGYCSITPRWGKTTVCLKRPKPTAGNDRYYATNQSRKACEMFELK